MTEDPIVAEIRRYRAEHAERYGHDLGRICAALREVEATTKHPVVHRQPQLLVRKKTADQRAEGNGTESQ